VDLEDLLRPVLDHRGDVVVAVDFDGTLSPIVDDPATARPLDGAPLLLAELAPLVGEVAVLSGRPVSFLEQFFTDDGVSLFGLYGLESRRGGRRSDHPSSGVWRESVAAVAERCRRSGVDGMEVEPKGLSITLHYRQHPDLEPAVRALAAEQAEQSGLLVRDAKMSVELHPPIAADKGTVLRSLAASHTGAVLVVGDDLGDLPAFDALDELATEGRPVVRVAVGGAEAPPVLTDRADVVLAGPEDVRDLLTTLVAG
jgi:trehalose 6-phosphate phosphatase